MKLQATDFPTLSFNGGNVALKTVTLTNVGGPGSPKTMQDKKRCGKVTYTNNVSDVQIDVATTRAGDYTAANIFAREHLDMLAAAGITYTLA